MIDHLWSLVKSDGYFLLSVRLTPEASINDISQSFQDIGDGKNQEKANYVVFNFREFMNLMSTWQPSPSHIRGYGYWGEPGSGVTTPYDSLVFAVFLVKKQGSKNPHVERGGPTAEVQLPANLFFIKNKVGF